MNVWQLITANSSAPPASTAWQHLNSQTAGGPIIQIGGEATAVSAQQFTAYADQPVLIAINAGQLIAESNTEIFSATSQNTLEATHE